MVPFIIFSQSKFDYGTFAKIIRSFYTVLNIQNYKINQIRLLLIYISTLCSFHYRPIPCRTCSYGPFLLFLSHFLILYEHRKKWLIYYVDNDSVDLGGIEWLIHKIEKKLMSSMKTFYFRRNHVYFWVLLLSTIFVGLYAAKVIHRCVYYATKQKIALIFEQTFFDFLGRNLIFRELILFLRLIFIVCNRSRSNHSSFYFWY